MPILNCFSQQKKLEYNTIFENEIFFSESISNVKQKLGTPINTENRNNQTTLEYKRTLKSLISTADYCFDNDKLCSVYYKSDVLSNDELSCFLSDVENVINENIFDSVIRYASCGKDYWELSDGTVSTCVCMYAKDNIIHIKIDYFD